MPIQGEKKIRKCMAKDFIKLALHLCKSFHSGWLIKFQVEKSPLAPSSLIRPSSCLQQTLAIRKGRNVDPSISPHLQVHFSLRCSDLHFWHSLGLGSKSEWEWQEAAASAVQTRDPEPSFLHQGLRLVGSSLIICIAEPFVLLLSPRTPALDLHLLFPTAAENRTSDLP